MFCPKNASLFSKGKAHDILQDPEVPDPVSMTEFLPSTRWVGSAEMGKCFVKKSFVKKKEAIKKFVHPKDEMKIYEESPML